MPGILRLSLAMRTEALWEPLLKLLKIYYLLGPAVSKTATSFPVASCTSEHKRLSLLYLERKPYFGVCTLLYTKPRFMVSN